MTLCLQCIALVCTTTTCPPDKNRQKIRDVTELIKIRIRRMRILMYKSVRMQMRMRMLLKSPGQHYISCYFPSCQSVKNAVCKTEVNNSCDNA